METPFRAKPSEREDKEKAARFMDYWENSFESVFCAIDTKLKVVLKW